MHFFIGSLDWGFVFILSSLERKNANDSNKFFRYVLDVKLDSNEIILQLIAVIL